MTKTSLCVVRLHRKPVNVHFRPNLHRTFGNYLRPAGGIALALVLGGLAAEGTFANHWLTSFGGLVNLAGLVGLMVVSVLVGLAWAVPTFPLEYGATPELLFLTFRPRFRLEILGVPWGRVVSATTVIRGPARYESLNVETAGDPEPYQPRGIGEFFARETRQLDIPQEDFRAVEPYLNHGIQRGTVVR
jgi:hypothetical protein